MVLMVGSDEAHTVSHSDLQVLNRQASIQPLILNVLVLDQKLIPL